MKIACVAYLHGAGGAERQIILLSNTLAEYGNEVHLIVLVDNKSIFPISDRVIVHDLTIVEYGKKSALIQRYKALSHELRTIKPDVSIHFWLQSAYLSAFMNKKYIGKVIYAERGDPGDKEYDGFLGIVRSIAFKNINGFVFQSEGARDYFNKRIRKKSVVIHNAVSVPEKLYKTPCSKRKKIIINVGRLHHQKNQKLLIKAFSIVSDKIPEYNLNIYGDGQLENDLKKQIIDLGLENRIFIYPSRKDIYDYIYNSSLFVLSSDFEGLPNVLMEAMALGVPCISTDCRPGGARTLINNGINGWIVPIGDAETLANKILYVLRKEEKLDVIENNAMNIRNTHKIDKVVKKWINYLEIINSNK